VLAELAGRRAADVLLLNDADYAYAKTRLDPASLAKVVTHIATFDNSLARAIVWAAAWDMVRDAEMPTRDYIALAIRGLAAEHDINLVMATLGQARAAIANYADPGWAPTGWAELNAAARDAIAAAEPGSGLQLGWARTYIATARSDDELDVVAGWLRDEGVPERLAIDTELRWLILQALSAGGRAGEKEINAELDNDRTAGGERQAAIATALIATPEAKAETWRRLTADDALPNWEQRALLVGFQHPSQVELTAPYAAQYFAVIDRIWSGRDSEQAQEFVEAAYPSLQVNDATVAATDEWLGSDSRPPGLRRLVGEGRDGIVRALAARARDAAG
jgi:aminopeptidase N